MWNRPDRRPRRRATAVTAVVALAVLITGATDVGAADASAGLAPATAAATVTRSSGSPAGSTAGSTAARTIGWNRSVGTLALEWGDLDANPRAGRGGYLVMQAWEYRRIPALKRANPHLRILMYKDVSAVVRTPDASGIYATGVSYAEAVAHA